MLCRFWHWFNVKPSFCSLTKLYQKLCETCVCVRLYGHVLLSLESDTGLWDTSSLGFVRVGNQLTEEVKQLQPKTEWRLSVLQSKGNVLSLS